MSDYIKREDAIKALEGWKISGEMILGTVPSADVVEVVRCKDCKYATYDESIDRYECRNWGLDDDEYTEADDYCSYGERAEE